MFSFIILCLHVCFINNVYSIPHLYTTQIMIPPDSTFMQYVYFDPDDGEATSCSLNYTKSTQKVTVDLDLNSEISNKENNRIYSVGRGVCGFKYINYTRNDPSNFNLQVGYTDKKNQKQSSSLKFRVIIYEHIKLKNEELEVDLGGQTEIKCGQKNVQVSCTLFNPKGEMVQHLLKECKYHIKFITIDDIGKWRCVPTITLTMEPLEEFLELKLRKKEKMLTWYKEHKGYGIIGCKFLNDWKPMMGNNIHPPKYCQLGSPDGKIVTISTGAARATKRYTTLGTKLDNYTCQLEMKLPLSDSEKGTWKCTIGDITGSFIRVKENTTALSYPKSIKTRVDIGQPFDILCHVPYSTENCYIQSPKGAMHNGGSYKDLWLGECKTTITNSSKDDIGKWLCVFSSPKSAEDDIIHVEVVPFNHIVAVHENVEVKASESAKLLCSVESAITYCRFEDPKGHSYHVSPKKNSSDISYEGKGLEYGDCGIKIKNVQKKDAGRWRCRTMNKPADPKADIHEISADINLEVN